MTTTIILSLQGTRQNMGPDAVWMARFVDDGTVRELFGTDTVPTPYTSAMPGETVRTEVARRNPDATVVLAVPSGWEHV